MVGGIIPQKLANATNHVFFFFKKKLTRMLFVKHYYHTSDNNPYFINLHNKLTVWVIITIL